MLKPNFQPIDNVSLVKPLYQSNEISLEGFNKAFGNPITLGDLHRSRDLFKSQGPSKGTSIACDLNKTHY